MNIEQAIEILGDTKFCSTLGQAAFVAISALEKQLPKRPHADDNGGAEDYECWLECTLCGEIIPEYTSENETECYCIRCGQRLDWSGDV